LSLPTVGSNRKTENPRTRRSDLYLCGVAKLPNPGRKWRWRCWCFKPFKCPASRRIHASSGRRRNLLVLHTSLGSQLHHVPEERRGERRGGGALGERGGGGQREDLELGPRFDSPLIFIDTAVFHKNPVIVNNDHPAQSARNSIECDPLGPSASP
ncbi:hypothetical protein Taro_047762, partial [Colocasia esculenta]|nr:hypothetical protein [Colocasia esculenta]